MTLTLIGMPGVGKTFIGKQLAEKINCRFIDTDELIEAQQNLSLNQVIEKFGEELFSQIEEEMILSLTNLNNCIISTGGSVVYSKKSMQFLKQKSSIIFLEASFESIKERISENKIRKIIGLKSNLFNLFQERAILYSKWSDFKVRVDNLDTEKTIEEIKHFLQNQKLF